MHVGGGAGERLRTAGGGRAARYFVDESKLPFVALPDTVTPWRVHGGAGYRIEIPADWDGKLVVWAHGFRGSPARRWAAT